MRVGDALRAFYTPGFSGEDRFLGLGEYSPFDPTTALAMALGALLVAVTLRRRLHLFVLVWAALVVLGAALLPGNVNTHRYYVGLPLFYLLVALGAGVLWDWMRRPAARAALAGVFAVAAIAAAGANVHRLYWRLFPDASLREHWIWPRTEIIRWVRARPRDQPICIVATNDDPGITRTIHCGRSGTGSSRGGRYVSRRPSTAACHPTPTPSRPATSCSPCRVRPTTHSQRCGAATQPCKSCRRSKSRTTFSSRARFTRHRRAGERVGAPRSRRPSTRSLQRDAAVSVCHGGDPTWRSVRRTCE